MALFSRRSSASTPEEPESNAADAATADAEADATQAPAEQVPTVNISVSTYGAPPVTATSAAAAPAARAAGPETRPAASAEPTTTVPGLPDNVYLRAALQALPTDIENLHILNVMRQTLQGPLYLRVQGDARALMAEGKPLNLGVAEHDGRRFLLAFSGGAALQDSVRADGDAGTSTIAQPFLAVLQNLLAGPYDGLWLDHATSGARLVLPKALVQKAVEEGDPAFTLKRLLSGARTDATAGEVVAALPTAKLWVAGNSGPEGQMGLAEARRESGSRHLEVFSHPLEVLALGRGDRPLPLTPEQLAKAVTAEPGLTGIVIDPAGPWIELSRADLAPLLALA
ncbi:SseB family protein [Microbacterium telephonicum]|uniref:Type III secretion system (T3SS) SseB-like protein n=1 Tax=Microbacterium telephonicum TaxID=1714841 RepID=A0A498C691_9MICO|nr:SseB family protein [Microbacterium telephonicum]RLK47881.1 type III secretion system (T3SS) SseB-like protein [Microbacterium telephonicum]